MHFSNATVVTLEEGQEILRQVVFVDFVERADNAKVQRYITAIARHQDVARVHIGMKETVAKNLRKENFNAGT